LRGLWFGGAHLPPLDSLEAACSNPAVVDESAVSDQTPLARPRLAWAALGFGLAALISSWQPVAAPFGLAVGLASAALSVRALRAGANRRPAVAGLVLALAAVAVSGTVLVRTAGPGRGGGTALVPEPPAGQAARAMDGAAADSRAARERARGELDVLERSEPPTPSR
jgi:hypothetical protein